MLINNLHKIKSGYPEYDTLTLDDFSLGLNTRLPASKLTQREMSAALNFELSADRGLQTRPGLAQLTNSAFTNAPYWIGYAPVDGTYYTLAITETDHKLYYLDASNDPTLIGTLEGEAEATPYKDVLMIFDGSYLKFWDGSNLEMAYDDGSGSTGCQVDQSTLDQDEDLDLGDGTTERVGLKFDSQAWDSGYGIPITSVKVYLKKTGSPTGNCAAKLRKQSDDSVVSTADTSLDVSGLTTSHSLQTFSFPGTDDMDPETSYYLSLEYDNGDGSNYISVAAETVASDGTAATHDGSNWSADTTANPCVRVQPGRPPKATFGVVHNTRLWIKDPDNPGRPWFSNANTYLDYSTSNGGGYVGIIDSDQNNFPLSGFVSHYEQLYFFGQKEQPFLCVLTGSTPSSYEVQRIMSGIWGLPKTIMSTVNDVYFASSEGAGNMAGVQEYGDIRAFSISHQVQDRFNDYWDSSAFAGYNPLNGQFLLQLSGYHRILVAHTRHVTEKAGKRWIPWTEWQFARDVLTDSDNYKFTESSSGDNEYYVEAAAGGDPSLSSPSYLLLNDRLLTEGTAGSLSNLEWDYGDNDTLGYSTIYFRQNEGDPDTLSYALTMVLQPKAFGNWNGSLYVACDDKHIYYLDSSVIRDNDIEARYRIDTPYITTDFYQLHIEKELINLMSSLGFDYDVSYFINLAEVDATFERSAAISDSITVSDFEDVLVDDTDFEIDPDTPVYPRRIGLVCRQFLVSLHNFVTRNVPIYMDSLKFYVRSLRR